jgi:hypothetical protein
VGFLERPHVLPAAEALPGLGHLHHVVFWVTHVVFLFGDVAGIEVDKEAVCLLLVHLLEVGDPLLGHLRFSFRSHEVLYLPRYAAIQRSPSHPTKPCSPNLVEGEFAEVHIHDPA